GQRPRERRPRQLATGERLQATVELVLAEPEAAEGGERALAPGVAAGVLQPCLRLGVAAERILGVVAAGHGFLQPPQLLLELDEVARARSDTERSTGGRWSCSATRVPLSKTSCPPSGRDSPARIRSSVVLPAPFGPESASRSRRSTLNETPSKSSPAESSLRRLVAITTAIAAVRLGRNQPPRSGRDRGCVDAVGREQLVGLARTRHLADREVPELARDALLGERSQHRLTDAARRPVVLDHDEPAGLARGCRQRRAVDRLDRIAVDRAGAVELLCRLQRLAQGDPPAAERDLVAVAEHAAAADRKFLVR